VADTSGWENCLVGAVGLRAIPEPSVLPGLPRRRILRKKPFWRMVLAAAGAASLMLGCAAKPEPAVTTQITPDQQAQMLAAQEKVARSTPRNPMDPIPAGMPATAETPGQPGMAAQPR